jgi:hypothetical protein
MFRIATESKIAFGMAVRNRAMCYLSMPLVVDLSMRVNGVHLL